MSKPTLSMFEWCDHCRNWFKILERKKLKDTRISILKACQHCNIRERDPNLDGPTPPPDEWWN